MGCLQIVCLMKKNYRKELDYVVVLYENLELALLV